MGFMIKRFLSSDNLREQHLIYFNLQMKIRGSILLSYGNHDRLLKARFAPSVLKNHKARSNLCLTQLSCCE